MPKLIDIHTHTIDGQKENTFALRNIIYHKEKIPGNTPYTIGIHPWYLPPNQEIAISRIEQTLSDPNVLAIGECGLDKNSDSPWDLQIYCFLEQIRLANRLNKPLIIHCVKSFQECTELLKESKNRVPVIFHGFAKNTSLAKQLIEKGYFLSLGHRILQGRHDDMLKSLPPDQIFFETDDRLLEIGDIYSYFCRVKKIEMVDLSAQIYENFYRVFKHKI